MVASIEVVQAAREYSHLGYAIVAVQADKKPLAKNWRRLFQLKELLEYLEGPKCPAIGFLGGDLNHHIVPLDFDTDEGEAWWQRQCEESGIDPDDFPTVITPGKIKNGGERKPGRHRYVTDVRRTLGNSEGALASLGINVRGKGHAMLPPSPHPDGGLYRWVDRHSLKDFQAIPPCPEFIYSAIGARTSEKTNGHAKPVTTDDRERRYAERVVELACAKVKTAQPGSRNKTLNEAAFALGRQIGAGRLGRKYCENTLMGAAYVCGLAEEGEKACRNTIASGLDAGEAKPAEPLGERRINEDVPRYYDAEPNTKPIQDFDSLDNIDSASELLLKKFSPLKWAIPDLVPEGLTVLAGRPKFGKSWLALDFALAAAAGANALGTIPCPAGHVLYLALEDTDRRLHQRIRAVLQSMPAPDEMEYATQWPRIDQGGLEKLRTWSACHKAARLIIVDTLQKFRGDKQQKGGVYADDYEVMGKIKTVADEFTIPIMVLTHESKTGNTDPLMAVSGTAAITGGADTVLSLQREHRRNPNAVLFVAGRDVIGDEIAIQQDMTTGKWIKLGKAEDFRVHEERRAIIRVLVDDAGEMTPKEIAYASGKNYVNIRKLLAKMVRDGEIFQRSRGKYSA